MNEIYVVNTASNSFYARIIRKLTKSEVNHTLILFRDKNFNMRPMAIQTDNRGVVIVDAGPLVNKKKTKVKIYKPESFEQLWNGMTRTMGYVGSKYDWLGIFGFLIKLVLSAILKKNIDNPIHRKGELFCSEYGVTVINKSKLKVNGFTLVPENTSPGFLDKQLEKDNYWTKIYDGPGSKNLLKEIF